MRHSINQFSHRQFIILCQHFTHFLFIFFFFHYYFFLFSRKIIKKCLDFLFKYFYFFAQNHLQKPKLQTIFLNRFYIRSKIDRKFKSSTSFPKETRCHTDIKEFLEKSLQAYLIFFQTALKWRKKTWIKMGIPISDEPNTPTAKFSCMHSLQSPKANNVLAVYVKVLSSNFHWKIHGSHTTSAYHIDPRVNISYLCAAPCYLNRIKISPQEWKNIFFQ